MIFTFSHEPFHGEVLDSQDLHVFCFFAVPQSVECPSDSWIAGVMASLKMKKNVLLLENVATSWITTSNKRWELGSGWIYLAPHSLSVISDNIPAFGTSTVLFRQFLQSFKPSKS